MKEYTKIPNVVFDWLPHLQGSELQVLLVVIRHTLGWHKERDAIATSTFMKETGLSNRGVMNALYRLESVNILHRYAEAKTHSYSLDFECEPDWKKPIGEHTSSVNSVHQSGEHTSPIDPKIGELSSHSKERFKENFKEKSERTRARPRGVEEVQAYFSERDAPPDQAVQFFDHFEANGWKVGGRSAMKDWQAAARNWIRRIPDFSPSTKDRNGTHSGKDRRTAAERSNQLDAETVHRNALGALALLERNQGRG